jgi:hypothetical protein
MLILSFISHFNFHYQLRHSWFVNNLSSMKGYEWSEQSESKILEKFHFNMRIDSQLIRKSLQT